MIKLNESVLLFAEIDCEIAQCYEAQHQECKTGIVIEILNWNCKVRNFAFLRGLIFL